MLLLPTKDGHAGDDLRALLLLVLQLAPPAREPQLRGGLRGRLQEEAEGGAGAAASEEQRQAGPHLICRVISIMLLK